MSKAFRWCSAGVPRLRAPPASRTHVQGWPAASGCCRHLTSADRRSLHHNGVSGASAQRDEEPDDRVSAKNTLLGTLLQQFNLVWPNSDWHIQTTG
jgi:hypothetical protein